MCKARNSNVGTEYAAMCEDNQDIQKQLNDRFHLRTGLQNLDKRQTDLQSGGLEKYVQLIHLKSRDMYFSDAELRFQKWKSQI